MSSVAPLAGPYAHAAVSVPRTMGLVMLGLVPATLFGLWQFGWPAIFLASTRPGPGWWPVISIPTTTPRFSPSGWMLR